MFKDTKQGETHYENDGCGEPAHNKKQMTPTLNASDREKGNAVNYLHVTGEGHCLRCHQDYMSGHLDHKCPKEGMPASVCNKKCDPRWNIKGVNDIPPSSEKGKCEPDNLMYTSNPPQLRCKHCGTFWYVHEPFPICKFNLPKNHKELEIPKVPPSSDSWDIRTEINTRLWYAHGAITPTSEEMERMVTSMEALLLSQEVRIKKEMREKVENKKKELQGRRSSFNGKSNTPSKRVVIGKIALCDELLTYLKRK